MEISVINSYKLNDVHSFFSYTLDNGTNSSQISKDDENELVLKARAKDEQAIELLINQYMGYIKMFSRMYSDGNLFYDDLIQEGRLGVLAAIEQFDPTIGSFSTFVHYKIRGKIKRFSSNNNRTVRVPVDVQGHVPTFINTYGELSVELGRTPSLDEIAEKMHITRKTCHNIFNFLKSTTYLDKKIEETSFDSQTISEFVSSKDGIDIEVMGGLYLFELHEDLKNIYLSQKERFILDHTFGLKGCQIYTQQQMADYFGVTQNSIKERFKRIMNKVRIALKNSYLNIGNPVDQEYYELSKILPLNIYQIFCDMNLKPGEIRIILYYLGIYNVGVKTKEELSKMFNVAPTLISNNKCRLFGMIAEHPKRMVIIEYVRSIKRFDEKRVMALIFRCDLKALDEALKTLSEEEMRIYNLRSFERHKLIMTKEEIDMFNNVVAPKIRQHVLKKNNGPVPKENNNYSYISSVTNSNNQVLRELLVSANDTPIFKEFRKFFSIKETLAIMMYCGFIDGKTYDIKFVSETFDMSIKELEFLFQRKSLAFSSDVVMEATKEQLKKILASPNNG